MPNLKLLIWMNMPSHHQSSLFAALRELGADLKVAYYGKVTDERVKMGWGKPAVLPSGERFVEPTLGSLRLYADWQERVHIVPGYGTAFTRTLARKLSSESVDWVHWSEASRSGFRWWRSYVLKRWYAQLVNRYAIGALAQGLLAEHDFRRWGIRREKIAHLTYSVAASAQSEEAKDAQCVDFCRDEPAFVYVGSLCHNKGIDVLLRAFKDATDNSAPWRLILVGPDKSSGRYRQLATILGIDSRVLFRGSLAYGQVASAVSVCQVCVLPSRYDGWGVVLNEAASLGLALISTDNVGSAYHLIDPGISGYRVRAGHVGSLSTAMRTYVHHPELTAIHGSQAKMMVSRYSPNANAERLMRIIASWRGVA